MLLMRFIMTEADGTFLYQPHSLFGLVSVPLWRFLENCNGQFGEKEETVVSVLCVCVCVFMP